MNAPQFDLANSGNELFCIANATVEVGEDGFALLAPFGDSHYTLPDPKGGTISVIQRVTPESAKRAVEGFNSLFSKAKRWFRGAPIFNGHPDRKGMENQYPDKEVKGLFRELEVRENGLYVRPLFNDAGVELLNSGKKLFFSVRWTAEQTGEKDGKMVLEPINVVSIGMTPNPNLPTELLNSAGQPPEQMNKKLIIAALIAAGFDVANEASDEQVGSRLADMAKAASNARTLENSKAEFETKAKAAEARVATLENERNKLLEHVLTDRQKSGAITEAERPVWERRVKADFTNEFPALVGIESQKIKTETNPNATGSRRDSSADSAIKKLVDLTHERMDKCGGDYETAYQDVCNANPEIFKQAYPEKN